MIQDVFVGIIVSATLIYIVHSTIKSIITKKSNSCDACPGCALKTKVKDVRFRTPSVPKSFTY
jgi:hypothetical protein